MATHSSILAWRIQWTEALGGLQSMGLQSRMQLYACTQGALDLFRKLDGHTMFGQLL